MSEPFKYTGAQVSINGIDLDATDVEITPGSAIFDNSPSGMTRALGSFINRQVTATWTFQSDDRGLYRTIKEMHAKAMDTDPVRVPTAQELVMRQELGEFDV